MNKLHLEVDKNGKKLFHAAKETKPQYHELSRDLTFPTEEDMACEAQLSALGVFEPLDININGWEKDEKLLKDYWVPFQPKKGKSNDRESILIYGPKDSHPSDPCGLAQLARIHGSKPSEMSMTYATEAKDKVQCLTEALDYFDFGRTFLVRLNAGGHYPPHRDHMLLTRPTYRLIAFLGDSTGPLRWEVEDHLVHFEPNTLYYVDTRKTHRLWSSAHRSSMLVCNVKKDWQNVLRLMTRLKYQG
tara:strand:+ start:48 stop:782 length:735 start_codon:yes stop_codon:yes gene_type:complete